MSPSEGQSKDLEDKHDELVVKFVSDVRCGKLQGSYHIAMATINLLEQVISELQNATALQLCSTVRSIGGRLSRALPRELVAANIVRRVLRLIRDEHSANANQSGESSGESLQRLVLAAPARRGTLAAGGDLREPVRDHLHELRAEVESSTASIAAQAREHVHADQLVLTYGWGALLEAFLKQAACTRYRLIVAEGDHVRESHGMAARLSVAGVAVTVVGSASVCGLMPRVNKVVVGAEAVLSGGAVLGGAGLQALAAAAHMHSVPVLVVSPLHALCPLHAADTQRFLWLGATHRAISYALCAGGASGASGGVHAYAPLCDLVPPEHVTLFITNLGGSSPSYIYRLLSELYDPSDHQL